MKKLIFSLFAAALLLTLAVPSSAVDISAGATTWYSWWDFNNDNSQNNNDIDPTLLYGPALSVKLTDRYNLTFVFLYGKFDMEEEGGTQEITRMDSDLALNYRLNSYIKLFAGAKYMGYTQGNDFKHLGAGPGAGISAVIPVGGDFYLLGNASGLYLWGEEDQTDGSGNKVTDKYNEFGINSSLSIAYYIVPASTTLSIGGRYQYFKTTYEDNTDDLTHHFYGITAAATYSFSL